jgi:tetratricopeptide (TPR) repeat protein
VSVNSKKRLHCKFFISSFFNFNYINALSQACIILFLATPSMAGDYDEGIFYFNNGDYKNAALYFLKGQSLNDAASINMLGVMKASGYYFSKNKEEAIEYYRKAAELNYAVAAYNYIATRRFSKNNLTPVELNKYYLIAIHNAEDLNQRKIYLSEYFTEVLYCPFPPFWDVIDPRSMASYNYGEEDKKGLKSYYMP